MRGLARHGTALTAIAASLALATTAPAATFKPTRTDDPDPDRCRPANCSLREAVRAAVIEPGNDKVVLGAKLYTLAQPENGNGDTLGGDLDLFNDSLIEIEGRGAGKTTIDAAGVDRVFEVFGENARVEIRGLKLTNGLTAGPEPNGGAISNEGRLTLQRVLVQDNEAGGEGGGLQNEETGVVKVTSSTFRDNRTASGDGGAINNRNDARITISGSRFLNNRAPSDGGGLANQNFGVMKLKRSTVKGNANPPASTGRGGGIFNQNDATLTVTDSTISGNTADTIGGGLFIQNNAVATFENSTISGNDAGEDGGGIYLNNWPTLSLSYTTLADNEAPSVGGGIYDGTDEPDALTPQPPFLIFRASIVAENTATIGANCEAGQPDVWKSKGASVEDGSDSCQFDEANDQPDGAALLRPLDRNGGPTETHMPRAASDAVDAAPEKGCPKRDQRGVKRPKGPRCDAGSVESR